MTKFWNIHILNNFNFSRFESGITSYVRSLCSILLKVSTQHKVRCPNNRSLLIVLGSEEVTESNPPSIHPTTTTSHRSLLHFTVRCNSFSLLVHAIDWHTRTCKGVGFLNEWKFFNVPLKGLCSCIYATRKSWIFAHFQEIY